MLNYIIKRVLKIIPILFLISIISFSLIYFAPYDAIDSIITPRMTNEEIQILKDKYGLNDPIHIQYINWLKKFAKGDFGYSILTHTNINKDLLEKIPNSIKLILPAYIISLILSLLFGSLSALKENSFIGRFISIFSSIGISTPIFWTALLLIYFFSVKLDLLPTSGMTTIGVNSLRDKILHFILPCLTLTISFMPDQIKYIRSKTMVEKNKNYVVLQKTLGATDLEILIKHISKNILVPLVTKIGMDLPMLITGSVIIETIFGWPGIGPYYVKAIKGLDYSVIMVMVMLSSVLVIIGNLISDIVYFLLDPRIRRN